MLLCRCARGEIVSYRMCSCARLCVSHRWHAHSHRELRHGGYICTRCNAKVTSDVLVFVMMCAYVCDVL
jgi:hypothetical protein